MQTDQIEKTGIVGTTEMLQQDNSAAALQTLGGFQLADYRLTERLGAGGYGEVWKAVGPGGLPKAVKVLYGERNGVHAESELKALERMRDLRHPFLLSIERIEVVNARLIVVTELADGNLSDRFEQCRSEGLPGIPRDELLSYLQDAAGALDFMSDKHGLQHLDIKPDNILVQGDHAKVGDFGLAKDLNATNVSVLNGFTPTYAAPELFEGRPGSASDQYSLAIVYQYMLTGSLPFNGRTAAQLTAQHLRSQPELTDLQPVDRPVIARALSKNMRSRFDSCRHLIEELSRRNHSRFRSRSGIQPAGTSATTTEQSDPSNDDTQHVSMVESVPVHINPQPAAGTALRPAVFVGVGGLGGAVLARLKSFLQSTSDNLFSGGMLHIDTDRNDANNSETVSTLLPEERLLLPLRTSKEFRAARDMDLSWLSRRWLFNIPRSQQVEGIRPLGRLALFDHRSKARNSLQQLVHLGLKSAATSDDAPSNDDCHGLDVFVVAGTTGGTGSGMIADVGLMIREIAKQNPNVNIRIHGLLMHSTGSANGTVDVQEANTVSLLRELAHMETPGLGTPRGFRNDTSDTTPFDDMYLVHLGDGLTHSTFGAETENVAAYIFNAVSTGAQFDFQAWRDAATEDVAGELRILGLNCQDLHSFRTTSEEAINLTSQILKQWCAADETQSGQATHAAADVSKLHAFLDELKLTDHTLTPQIRTLLKGNLGTEIQACADRAFQQLQTSHDLSSTSREEFLHAMSAQIAKTPHDDGTQNLNQLVAGLKTSLSGITRNCCKAIRQHLTAALDAPHRLSGAVAAANCVSTSLAQTIHSCQAMIDEIQTAFVSFSSGNDSTDNQMMTIEAAQGCSREYCCLVAYQLVYQCFLDHVSTVASDVADFEKRLDSTAAMILRSAETTGSKVKTAMPVPAPIVDAFDRHIRNVQPNFLGAAVTQDTTPESWTGGLIQLASQFLTAASQHTRSDATATQGDFPKNVWPRIRGIGGQRRVLSVVPQGADSAELEQTLRREFDDCVAVRQDNTPCVFTVCETSGVQIQAVLTHMTRSNPHVADVAGRIHTRTDVDW